MREDQKLVTEWKQFLGSISVSFCRCDGVFSLVILVGDLQQQAKLKGTLKAPRKPTKR